MIGMLPGHSARIRPIINHTAAQASQSSDSCLINSDSTFDRQILMKTAGKSRALDRFHSKFEPSHSNAAPLILLDFRRNRVATLQQRDQSLRVPHLSYCTDRIVPRSLHTSDGARERHPVSEARRRVSLQTFYDLQIGRRQNEEI